MESMKDFEKELDESLKNRKQYDDPDAGKWEVFQKMMDEKTVNRVKIVEVVKGGCVAYLEDMRAFIPASQLSTSYVEDLTVFQGKHIDVVIITVDQEKKRLVLSHRELERQEQEGKKKARLAELKAGESVTGKVESIKDYGVFVDIGDGLSGLIHVSQLAHKRVKHPSLVLKVGDEVTAKILSLEGGKISLSKKALEANTGDYSEDEDTGGYVFEGSKGVSTSLGDLLKNVKLK